jgi:hypothetical protein
MKSVNRLAPPLVVSLIFLVANTSIGQQIDAQTYSHKMQLVDSLSFYKLQRSDTLYEISTVNTSYNRNFRSTYDGWIITRTRENIEFINIHGGLATIDKKRITNMTPIAIKDSTIERFLKPNRLAMFDLGDLVGNYLLSCWLYKKGEVSISKQLLPSDTFHTDRNLINTFGDVYYDAMLSAFSYERNYQKAISIGKHLPGSAFNGYEYQKEAIALTHQLKNNPEDFKTFLLPDSSDWMVLEQKLNRQDRIVYLADRLRLLNCIQPGQPGGISYAMYQFSVPYNEAQKLNISYWDRNPKYEVINPSSELIKMNLNMHETELLLPYLLSNDYIASYSYFRDFMPQRTLHKVSWVVSTLLYEITDRAFFDRHHFDLLPFDQKKAEVDKIKEWCDENASLSAEERVIKILKTTDRWADFQKAMQTAKEYKYDSLLPILVARFNDFSGGSSPTRKGMMSETMYELGNEKYVLAVKSWSRNTTDMWVNLWSAMFLLKYDTASYETAMKELEKILNQDDGTTYYPHAMELLLSRNDQRARRLAEGILDRPEFSRFVDWDYYLNFIKELLRLKSDYTFDALSKQLNSLTPDQFQALSKNGGDSHMMEQGDNYVIAVSKLKYGDLPNHYFEEDNTAKLAYRKDLGEWFNAQYKLLKEGKPNELNLKPTPTDAPVTFIDAPRDY